MGRTMKNDRQFARGFTLIELLIVLAMIGILGVIALATFFNTIGTFTYFGNYKNIVSTFRTARSMAITNATVPVNGVLEVPDRYGIRVSEDDIGNTYNIDLFADTGDTALEFDGRDYLIPEKQYSINRDLYNIVAWDSNPTNKEIDLPIVFFYETRSGNFYAYREEKLGNVLLPKANQRYKYIALQFETASGRYVNRFLITFQVSGLPEEYFELL
ncbi:prepilin-type N-terminal cleavage/methylation domain-containing protein [Candidatus Peregrinibacteria bacterium]|nr:prepilin-type N-terminal cleavage/methylation domain-containing protein [Candidatus Peregrinibacteria bacterium]